MKHIYTFLIALFIGSFGFGQTTIYTQDFETLNTGYTASATEGSGFTDIFNRTNTNTGGNSSYFWAIEDTGVTPATITLDQIDVTGYADFTFSIDMLAHHYNDWDDADTFSITYTLDGGATQNLLWVRNAGGQYNQAASLDTDFDGVGDCGSGILPAITTGNSGCNVTSNTFATFSSSTIILSGNTTLDIVLSFEGMTSGDEGMYLDNIEVEGNLAGGGCTAPTAQASAYNTTSIGTTSATLNWTIGNGDEVLVLVKEGSAVDTDPEIGTTYTGNTVFTSGAQIGTGNYVVQSGSATSSVSITGLSEATTYHVAVYEYNTIDTCYELTELTGNFTTECSTPSEVNTFTATAGNEEVDLTWSNGSCFDEILVIAKETSAVTVTPSGDGTAYTANATFGSSADLGTSEYAVYKGIGTSVTVTGLTNGNTYHFSVFTRKATSWSTAVADDATLACTAPAIQASTFTTLSPTTTDVSIEFTRGGGDDVLVVMKEGSAVDTDPTSGTSYNANSIFNGSGASEIGTGNYVVFNGNNGTSNPGVGGTSLNISVSGLSPNTTYYLAVYEYNTTNTCYNLTELTGNFTTECSTPSDVSAFTANEGNTDVDLTWTNGTCYDEILVVAKAGSAVTNSPSGDGTAYTADVAFGFGTDIGSSEFVVYKGSGNSVSVTGLMNGTTYHFEVFARKASTWSSGITANAIPNLTYCDPNPSSVDGSGIINVNIGTINNSTSAESGNYGDYSAQSTDVSQGQTVTFNITFSTGIYDYNTKIWIDYNNNGNFDDFDEEVFSGTSDPSNLSGSFIIPVSASIGQHRLRIGGADSATPTPCYTGSYASYEDYTINVIAASTDTSVQFTSTSTTVLEDAGTYDLEFSIINEDLINATTFDVVLTSGDNTDIDGYTTQTVTFLGGTTTNQTVTITVTDDAIIEGDETLTFEIQNVTGGSSAAAGSSDSFDLTITASDAIIPATGDIVISEIMYNSLNTDDEWIEIYNASGNDITLDSDWELNYGSNSFDFSGTLITAGSYITIALGSNGDSIFNNDNPFTPDVSTIATPAATASTNNTNNLVNSSSTITIVFDPNGDDITIDTVTYDDGSPWPNAADGDGPSLELVDLASDNSLGSNWVASDNFGGTPGSGHPVTYTFNGTWSPSDPNGAATASDDIVITSGNAIISSDTAINSVTVNPGAGLTINSGVTLTVTNGLSLESSSSSYSSLITDGTISGTVNYDRFVNSIGSGANGTGGNDLISLPLMPIGLTFDTFITNGDNATEIADNGTFYAFAPYNNINASAYENFLMGASDILIKAKGYRVATDSGNLITFSGTPDNSTVNFPIVNPVLGNQWNLIGNPYPSYIDADLFLSVTNTALLDASAVAIYAYNSETYTGAAPTTSDFTIINKATIASLTGENFNIAPGQGFFVASNAIGGAIEFTPAMRTLSGDDDYIAGRNSNESNYFKLNLIGSSTYSTSIFFNTNSSLGLDPGYDAVVYGENSDNYPIFTHLVEENMGRSMAIQSLDNDDLANVTIPLGINANQGEAITFSINSSNLSSTTLVYLEDNVTNTFTLLNSGDYTLTPNMNLSGTGRFYLRVSNSTLSTIDHNLDQLSIYTNTTDKTIFIAGQLLEPTTASVYDVQGRLVSTTQLQTTVRSQAIDVSNLSPGIYVVKLHNAAQNKTQKVIIR
ncbi:putative secreted protein (Por secretion system target) [Winogradskyella pacifica]|uniref:Putative secreted protein (Por secretion system target) n=1 Tax=Winogradskyella pacifica TaxID=664642 RepID=A0A3D9N5V1_9FLAO|nr:GEVED domain-containing protein [Winogradskyella pacifica]REE27464.1 putative secreted protein (Por secretion system target) [Winogradskyella pacifica]